MRHLLLYCDRFGIDYQEIDDTLTYWENKKHLLSLAKMLRLTGDTFELARMESLQEQYMKEHPLHYFLCCQMAGTTKSSNVGKPIDTPGLFSLRNHVSKLNP